MPNKIIYNRVDWEDNETELSAKNLDRIEQGIQDCVDGYNSVGDWAKSPTKPTYTASEIGAPTTQQVVQQISAHNSDEDAHSGVLARKNHTHKVSDLEGISSYRVADSEQLSGKSSDYYLDYNNLNNTPQLSDVATSGNYLDLKNTPKVPETHTIPIADRKGKILLSSSTPGEAQWSNWNKSGVLISDGLGGVVLDTEEYLKRSSIASNSAKLNGKDASYYLDFNNLNNTPETVIKTSQLINDGSNGVDKYISSADIDRSSTGVYISPYVTEEKDISTGFRPDKLAIYQRVSETSSPSKVWIFNESEIGINYKIEFTDYGFKIKCNPETEFNMSGFVYTWIATSTALTTLPVVDESDNGKVLQVVDGRWQKSELPPLPLMRETWTFILEDDTEITREVALWE